ncbi:hypothetical protein SAICODRAFT_133303 [Saitoella complicata NRRL Y-17804]|uniref:uncharacterized protein n=1 Tax=Saitoella complicata (strain BCRC 22490 / CBS 7301 / JCM 7358 / NBRC 10748 / NRRL Y-17804) TaxID=698492 RepID=UPI0008680BD9|nr:uncharacterized protein SAICODRAFT_133303 [Saitoella complicata NRRL Y-17804]ODQ52324.1 hypothetical protein SAICODRAFT_133303 [Saitoella complicata NRRL Y-17804]
MLAWDFFFFFLGLGVLVWILGWVHDHVMTMGISDSIERHTVFFLHTRLGNHGWVITFVPAVLLFV